MTAANTSAHRRSPGGRGARLGTGTTRKATTRKATPRKATTRKATTRKAGTMDHARGARHQATSRLARTLTDHDEIRRWAEERGGKPTAVKGTSYGKDDVGMIRIDFPGYSGEGKLEPIEWDRWFEKFDESNLALTVQDKTASGEIATREMVRVTKKQRREAALADDVTPDLDHIDQALGAAYTPISLDPSGRGYALEQRRVDGPRASSERDRAPTPFCKRLE